MTEYNYPEKMELARKLTESLQKHFANKYGEDSEKAKEISVILLEKYFDEKDCEKLDKMVSEELK